MDERDIRRITIDEREYNLTESQLRQMLDIAGRHHGRDSYIGRISSFCAGLSTATGVALLTVPSTSFQNVGAIDSNVVYGGCLGLFVISALTAAGLQFAKRLGAFGKAMSTDAVMASLLNPQQAGARQMRHSDGGPQMALRADERAREKSYAKPIPLLEAEPKAVVRRRDDKLDKPTDEVSPDEPIKTNSEIVRSAPDDASPALSESQLKVVAEIRQRGLIDRAVLEKRHRTASSDIDALIGAGVIVQSGSSVFLTHLGRLLVL